MCQSHTLLTEEKMFKNISFFLTAVGKARVGAEHEG
jgi:hypothetical protein